LTSSPPSTLQLFATVTRMMAQSEISLARAHVSFVHFSSTDSRTDIAFNLDRYPLLDIQWHPLVCRFYTAAQAIAAVNAVDIVAVTGVTDLNAGLSKVLTGVLESRADRANAPNAVVVVAQGLYVARSLSIIAHVQLRPSEQLLHAAVRDRRANSSPQRHLRRAGASSSLAESASVTGAHGQGRLPQEPRGDHGRPVQGVHAADGRAGHPAHLRRPHARALRRHRDDDGGAP